MQILQFFEALRHPVLTQISLGISWLGNDIVLILLMCLIFWLFDKWTAYNMCIATLTCMALGQMLNLYLTVARPFVRWPQLNPVPAARVESTGYSFPSGTTINATGAFGMGASFFRGWRRAGLLLLPLLVAVSRLYLGTNTATDVAASLLIGLVFVWLVSKVSAATAAGQISRFTVIATAILTAAMLGAAGNTAPGSFSPDQRLDAFRSMGSILGITLGAIIETRWIRFNPRAGWRLQAVKLMLGFGGLGIAYHGSLRPLTWLFGAIAGDVLRYVVLFLWIVAGLPALANALRPLLEPSARKTVIRLAAADADPKPDSEKAPADRIGLKRD